MPWNGLILGFMPTTAYIGANFFSPVENDQIRLILTFAALAIAFLLRPIGELFWCYRG